ncbi:DinB family protein [Desulfohalovibrio reitneri]|uniref:DinB family protein n=1 Tax=Desulfohalovibrio reitneri TaxID=1307759 RepID=UPI0004A74AE7|nr:DinB family protein [Desulfohalovibrio reitneri]
MDLTARLNELQQLRHRLLRISEEAPPSAWRGEGGWRLGQLLEHLTLAERDMLGRLPTVQELRRRPNPPRGPVSWLRRKASLAVLEWPLPMPVTAPRLHPGEGIGLEEAHAAWAEAMGWLRRIVDGLGPDAHRLAVLRHVSAGRITLAEAVRIDMGHFRFHAGRIERLALGSG